MQMTARSIKHSAQRGSRSAGVTVVCRPNPDNSSIITGERLDKMIPLVEVRMRNSIKMISNEATAVALGFVLFC